jgi:uncharacterized protein YdeI (YjbR/CyaY-like superfamily)
MTSTLLRSASDHPATGTYDFPLFHPSSRAAWRAWLEAHHATERGAWVVSWRRQSGREPVPYEHLVLESLCFGWIDATRKVLDDDRGILLMTPRKPRSGWTRLNRRRVADLDAQGLMTDSGRRAIEVAKANGWWSLMDDVEDLVEPDDLATALDATPAARHHWDGFAASLRKQMLWWLITAAKPDTRARRIAAIVAEAAEGRPRT